MEKKPHIMVRIPQRHMQGLRREEGDPDAAWRKPKVCTPGACTGLSGASEMGLKGSP